MHEAFIRQANTPDHLTDAFANERTAELLGLVRHYEGYFSDEHNDKPDVVFTMLEEKHPKVFDRTTSFDQLVEAITLVQKGSQQILNADKLEAIQNSSRRETLSEKPLAGTSDSDIGKTIEEIQRIRNFGFADHTISHISAAPFRHQAAETLHKAAEIFKALGLKETARQAASAANLSWPNMEKSPQQSLSDVKQLLAGVDPERTADQKTHDLV